MYTITKYAVVNGEVVKSELDVYERKIPFLEIRKKLLAKHENYMQLHTDLELENMTRSDLMSVFELATVLLPTDIEDVELPDLVKKLKRTRTIANCYMA